MNKEKKKTRVPKLRFPEFREAGEWVEKEVGDVFKVTRGNVLAMSLVQETQTDKMLYPVYSSQTKNDGLAGFYSEYLFEDAITWTTDGANAGDVNFRKGRFYCTNVCGVLINKNGHANPFVAALINSVSKKHVSYVGNPKLMNGVMSKIIIPFPSVEEQQKIARFLTSLDDLITTQSEKIKALQAHKKGLMQRLFPAEGERVPRVRFGEFEGEWEERTLGEVAEVITGNTPSTFEASNYGGNRMFVSPADIGEGRYISCTKTTLTEKGYSQTRHVRENSILFVCIGSTIGKIAQNKYECATNQQINSVVPYVGCSSEFLYSVLEYDSSKIASLAGRQAVPIINKSAFSSVQLKFPPTEVEQQKIAATLTALDDLIAAQGEKLEALKAHKKGLMQGLFPTINQTY